MDFEPLWKELKSLLVPLALAGVLSWYGLAEPNPPIFIAGVWAFVVTVAIAVFRSLRSLPPEGPK